MSKQFSSDLKLKAVNSDRFNEFIKDICDSFKNKLIILDNGQIHKKESTRKIIKDSGNYLLYTFLITKVERNRAIL